MSIATTKVAIDKLAKMYEPLRYAQDLLADLEAAEQRLKEVTSQTEGEANAVKLLKNDRDKLIDAVKKLRDNHDATMQLTAGKAAEDVARAKQDVLDIERAGAGAKRILEAEVAELQKYLTSLEGMVAVKAAELAKVEAAIEKHRAALRKAAESV
jgi:DNA repair exonuclease SbcCD ATPase subunit